jgi:hypothetical protein
LKNGLFRGVEGKQKASRAHRVLHGLSCNHVDSGP